MPPKPPHPGVLRQRIAELAAAGAVSYSLHAFDDRMGERSIYIDDALNVLKRGMIKGDVVPGDNPGEWKCKMIDQPEGRSRWLGVVVVVVKHNRLLIVTVEWEDR